MASQTNSGGADGGQAGAPWAPGHATGVGSMPGADPDEAMRVVVGELADFPHLVELPAAGIGSDMIGRATAHLVGMHVELSVSGWRFSAHAGADERRAKVALRRDLDVLEAHTQGFVGPLKIQCAGPWTLAAGVELRHGDKALADPGAVRDIAVSLAEGVAEVARDVASRVPGARVVVQLDEPSLPGALRGAVPTASGFGALPIVESVDAVEKLRLVAGAVAAAGGTPIAHCCASDPPLGIFVDAGMRAVSLDAGLLTPRDDDSLGEAIEAGVALFLGLVPSIQPGAASPAGPGTRRALSPSELAAPAVELWSRLGFAPDALARQVVVTPTCGLAGAAPTWAAQAYALCREVARVLVEEPEPRRSRISEERS